MTKGNFRILIISCCLCLFITSTFAQQPPDDDSNSNGIRTITAVKVGRAGDAFRQQQIHASNQGSGQLAPPEIGDVNPHKLPPELLLNGQNQTSTGQSNLTPQLSSPILATPSVTINAEGYGNDDNANLLGTLIAPPDTNGDVGLNEYVQYVNLGWVVIDKATGQQTAGPFAGNTFWQGFGGICETQNAGDPIVLYDHLAGRWFFSQFTGTTSTDGHQCIAISDGESPLGPYTLYDFIVSPNGFNDYPKITLWPDGYYMTTHEFSGDPLVFTGTNLTVFDREEMLAGLPNAGAVQFAATTSGDQLAFGTQVGHLEGFDQPATNSCNYLIHASDVEAFGLQGLDRFRFWKACIDFDTPNNSALTQINSVNVPTFDQNLCGFSRDCIDQNSSSGQLVDPLAGFTMYRFNNRYFPAEGVFKNAVTTSVDIGGDQAGILWAGFDINPVSDSVAIGDTGDLMGIIDFGDNFDRWVGSASLDRNGNIGIGYNVAGPGLFPSIAFAVHERGVDGAGQLQAESFCVTGTGSSEGTNRWADYASTSVDPVDSCTFWHTNEYVETTGNFAWNTRVCSFAISSCLNGGGPLNNPPVADFSINCAGLNCNFDASNSSDINGIIISYIWDFGDGNQTTGQSVSNQYSTAGAFTITLTVTDNAGAVSSSSQTINVPTSQPSIQVIASPNLNNSVRLFWAGSTTSRVDIFRNGTFFERTRNDGQYIDRQATDTATYQICNRDTNDCSNIVTVEG